MTVSSCCEGIFSASEAWKRHVARGESGPPLVSPPVPSFGLLVEQSTRDMGKASDSRSALAVAFRWSSNIMAVSLAMALPALVGNWLDGRWGTAPALVLAGTALGMVTAFVQLMRLVRGESGGRGNTQR